MEYLSGQSFEKCEVESNSPRILRAAVYHVRCHNGDGHKYSNSQMTPECSIKISSKNADSVLNIRFIEKK